MEHLIFKHNLEEKNNYPFFYYYSRLNNYVHLPLQLAWISKQHMSMLHLPLQLAWISTVSMDFYVTYEIAPSTTTVSIDFYS